jgi:hypothetical protein
MDLTLILLFLIIIGAFIYFGYKKKENRAKEGKHDSDINESSIDKHNEKNTRHRN